jgi:uncharacterized protein YkwD
MIDMKAGRVFTVLVFLAILLIGASTAPNHPVMAQGDDASELISLINALRASHGLAPYTVDPGLTALAQEQSAYQASIHTCTHQRSDSSMPGLLGVTENVACGDLGYLDPHYAVYEIWADPGHLSTMIGFAAGLMGVGVADDGKTVYYTLDVRSADTTATMRSPTEAVTTPIPSAQAQIQIPLVPLITMTPRSNGAIVHVVGYGQTLWAIALAYGVQIEQIRAWNNIPDGSNDIYAGQKLLVRPAGLALPTAAVTPFAASPTLTNTVEVTSTPLSPTSGPTSPDTAIPDQTPPFSNQPVADSVRLIPIIGGIGLLVGCILLLILRIPKKPS